MKKISVSVKNAVLPYCSAVIVAGGSSVRFGADKLFAEINHIPVLGMTLQTFADAPCIQEIILVVRQEILSPASRLARAYGGGKVSLVVPGGSSRLLSSFAGVMSASKKAKLIAIHDGARPLVTEKIISDAVWTAHRHYAAVPAIPVRDTIKLAQNGIVTQTPDRSSLFAAQTPQVFHADIIKAALTDAIKKQLPVTDDCSAAEAMGVPVFLCEGDEDNIKITSRQDILLAEAIVQRRTQ